MRYQCRSLQEGWKCVSGIRKDLGKWIQDPFHDIMNYFFLVSDMYLGNCSMYAGNSSIWTIFNSKGINELNMKTLQRVKAQFALSQPLEYEC